jgi:RNA polymerase sigma-70 factor, ECF subfamily
MAETSEDVGAERQVSDHSLMKRLRMGSEDAATQIYLRYAHRLRALARAQSSPELARCVDADEMVQSVFGSFFRGARNGYYDVPVGDELWKLFLVIALNKIRAKGAFYHAAKRDVRMTTGGALLEKCPEIAQDDSSAALNHLQLTIEEAMQSLPDKHREIVSLRIEGYQVEEIAERTHRSKRTVERILQDVRKRLSYFVDEA